MNSRTEIKGDDSMKLERLSENQIRCTLNKADLADRELLLNELDSTNYSVP